MKIDLSFCKYTDRKYDTNAWIPHVSIHTERLKTILDHIRRTRWPRYLISGSWNARFCSELLMLCVLLALILIF